MSVAEPIHHDVLAERTDDELLAMAHAEFAIKRELRKRGYRQRFHDGSDRYLWVKGDVEVGIHAEPV